MVTLWPSARKPSARAVPRNPVPALEHQISKLEQGIFHLREEIAETDHEIENDQIRISANGQKIDQLLEEAGEERRLHEGALRRGHISVRLATAKKLEGQAARLGGTNNGLQDRIERARARIRDLKNEIRERERKIREREQAVKAAKNKLDRKDGE